jgi:hypothetical protein
MTLITNEIHMLDGFNNTVMVFAADRRMTKLNGTFDSVRPKLFRIPYLKGGVSYFGLAEFLQRGRNFRLWEWLPAFITRNNTLTNLRDFAFTLREELNSVVPPSALSKNPSGFHIAGYNADGFPEFWYLTNIGSMNQFKYKDLQSCYGEPSSDFLNRDAIKLGWDGKDPGSVANKVMIYRNGDFRAHVAAWEKLDGMLSELMAFPDFRKLSKPKDFEAWVRFKMEVIAHFYKKFANLAVIGTPIDVWSLSKELP